MPVVASFVPHTCQGNVPESSPANVKLRHCGGQSLLQSNYYLKNNSEKINSDNNFIIKYNTYLRTSYLLGCGSKTEFLIRVVLRQ